MRALGRVSTRRRRGGKYADGIASSPSVSLVYGLSAYDGGAGALNGATITAIVYPSLTIISTAGLVIDHCEWSVDSTLFRNDDLDAPYEMKPGNVGVPFNVNPWVANGAHTVTAHLVFVGGSTLDTVANVTISGLGGGEPPPPPILGRPDQSNTGHVAAGVATGALTVYNGSPAMTAGSTWDSYWFQSAVSVDHATFTRCRFSGNADTAAIHFTGTGGVMTDCTVAGDGAGPEGMGGIWGSGTFTRCQVYGTSDGIVPDSGAYIDSCYITNLSGGGSPHYDGIEIDGARSNITIIHATIEGRTPTSPPAPAAQTSGIMTDNYFGDATNIVIDGCWISGGGYAFYADGDQNPANLLTVTVRNCVFELKVSGFAGQFGNSLVRGPRTTLTQSNNVDSNGAPVTL